MAYYFLDTNILIDLIGKKQSRFFLERALNEAGTKLGTSILSVAEFMVGAHAKERDLLEMFLDSEEIEVVPLDSVDLAKNAARLRKEHFLTLPDALILASAIRQEAHLLTHDTDLLKKAKRFLKATDPFMTDES
jgi:predicted nucleic acid-binding protein